MSAAVLIPLRAVLNADATVDHRRTTRSAVPTKRICLPAHPL